MVVLQDSFYLAHDVELPVVQNLSQVGHTTHAHPLSWVKNSGFMLLPSFSHYDQLAHGDSYVIYTYLIIFLVN